MTNANQLATTLGRKVGPGSRFVPVSKPDVEALLVPLGFVPITVRGTQELVFAKPIRVNGNFLSLRVLTGVNSDGTARPLGKDAIRCQLWVRNHDGYPVRIQSTKRTMRVFTWAANLRRKIDHLVAFAYGLPEGQHPEVKDKAVAVPIQGTTRDSKLCCPRCGAGLTPPKQGRRGLFFGCLRFPVCRGLVDASNVRA